MPAVQVSQSDRYSVVDRRSGQPSPFPFSLVEMDANGASLVDMFRTRSGAFHAARMLNSGVAVVDPHGLIGCRVRVKS